VIVVKLLQRPPAILKNFKSGTLLTQKQIWHESGECPIGTIPVRRTLVKDILQAGSIHNYRKKKGGLSAVPKPSSATILQSSHEVILCLSVELPKKPLNPVELPAQLLGKKM
jgi:hypothetical protein